MNIYKKFPPCPIQVINTQVPGLLKNMPHLMMFCDIMKMSTSKKTMLANIEGLDIQ